MKRIALVAALAGAVAVPAFAQSSLQVYGRLNTSVERQRQQNETTVKLVDNASRLGFKGTEDLGGGLKAVFQLEHGFNVDDGKTASASFWGRESWVGLAGGFGTVRFGNTPSATYFATADYVSLHNHDTGSSEDKLYAYVMRTTNKVAYTTPSFGGLTLEGQYSLREGVAGQGNAWEIAANFDQGPLHLGGGFTRNEDDRAATVRALFEFGAFTFGGYYQRDEFEDEYRNNYRLAGMYTMGASEFHLNFGYADDRGGVDDTGAQQVTAAYNYNLSKRTKLFAFWTKVRNDDDAVYFPNETTGGPIAGGDFSSFALGVRHNF
ncbi:porin [Caldimonas brevitalea]|uniref:Porin n=1 Tax=Caldimonas brevitalea TaxID=413882 RepID=A0A0G3BZ60_9BURK|nr:porin [Caldimonas brevitalea]AKJ31775.1 porin [Caldimonas brevitalea]